MEQQTQVTEEKKPLSAAETKALFEAVDTCSDEVAQLEKLLEEARAKKSDAIKNIAVQLGSNGPFEWKGRELTITKRGDTYYFRGESEKKVTKIG
jgi:hypothetical protein